VNKLGFALHVNQAGKVGRGEENLEDMADELVPLQDMAGVVVMEGKSATVAEAPLVEKNATSIIKTYLYGLI